MFLTAYLDVVDSKPICQLKTKQKRKEYNKIIEQGLSEDYLQFAIFFVKSRS